MVEPVPALLGAAALLAIACLAFWPKHGLIVVALRALRRTRRVDVEDALKHLHDCEYRDVPGTLESIAGALAISSGRAARLVTDLGSRGLARQVDDGLRLTAEGRRRALRIVRIHRLWETYFADRTGFAEADWHVRADRREHRTSDADVTRLVIETGNPLFDPHGDPIPTAEGMLPSRRGRSLAGFPAGTPATIVHVEDEPEAVYAQLRAHGLRAGMDIAVLEIAPDEVRVSLEGTERRLTTVAAGNVTVAPLPANRRAAAPAQRLSNLEMGESAEVVDLAPACRGLRRRRLLDLGLVPGTRVAAVLRSAAGDPTGYRIHGAVIALRRAQAEQVQVERDAEGGRS